MAAKAKRICKVTGIVFLSVIVSVALFSYFLYRDFRKELVVRLSDMASDAIGQRVDIGDISLGLSVGIDIDDLRIRNPEGFPKGSLLVVKKITLDPDYRAIMEGDIHLRKATISAPALTLVKDARGRLNISDGLRRFFSKKGTIQYRIDEIALESGLVDFNHDPRLRAEDIGFLLKDLSSRPDVKAVFRGTALWAGVNKVGVGGWAFPGAEPKRFSISLSTESLRFTPFSGLLSQYRVDAEKTRGDMRFEASGDNEKGAAIAFSLKLKSPGFRFYKKILDIELAGDLDYHLPADSADLKSLSMKVGGTQVLSMKGRIGKTAEGPAYDLTAKVENLDLSAFDVMKGIALTGLASSDTLRIKGKGTRALPEIRGAVKIMKGSFGSADLAAGNIGGTVKFSSDRGLSADIGISASLKNVAGHSLTEPANARLSVSLQAGHRAVTFSGVLDSSPAIVGIGGKPLSLGAFGVSFDGLVRGSELSGKGSFTAKRIGYGDQDIAGLRVSLGVKYGERTLAVHPLKIESDRFSLTADSVEIRQPGSRQVFLLVVKGMDAAYPSREASLKGADLSGELHTAGDMSRRFDFSASGVAFGSASAAAIAGRAEFSKESFLVDLLHAGIAGGTLVMTAQGRTSGGPFPLRVEAIAKDVDAGELTRLFEKGKMPYRVSGRFERAAFSGTADSTDSVLGRLDADIPALSVVDEETKRDVLKDASLHSEMTFQGKDCTFTAGVSVGKVAVALSGEAKRFMEEVRSVRLKARLAETPAAEIRNAFWGVFPDSLLYNGMEGSLASDVTVGYRKGKIVLDGTLSLRGFTLIGENDEYSIGPVNGTVPIVYGGTGGEISTGMPFFERSDFGRLKKSYTEEFPGDGYRRIDAGSFRYGFRLLSDIAVWVKQEKGGLKIGRFSANIFGGRLSGSAVVDVAEGLRYRAGFVLDGMSLRRLCDDIEPIKGYISGKVDGVGMVRGSGTGLRQIIGKTDFWTYSTKDEETKVSREFLQKIGGPTLKAYIGGRRFDKGEMVLYLQKGFVIFRELEISHRNFFGMQDLSVKVAPLSNKISIGNLMWSIVEAASRAQKKGQ